MRKSPIIRLAAAAALVLGGAWMAYTQGRGPAASKLDTVKIKDDLFVIHNEAAPGNVTVLVTNDGVLLVDDKFAVDHAGIMEQLKKITDKPIKYVINTHHHGDHTGGNAQMLQMDALIVASQQARENMVDGKMPGLPNLTVERHAQIFLGGKVAELYYFGRAHTNGDIVILFSSAAGAGGGGHVHFRRRHSPVDRLRRRRQREGVD